MVPMPVQGALVAVGAPQWAPVSVVPPWQQVGRYATPIPTQVPAYYPDIQKRCGVEGLHSEWTVPTAGDTPYYLNTPYPQNVSETLRTGRAPGRGQGAGSLASILGPSRAANAQQETTLAQSLLGW